MASEGRDDGATRGVATEVKDLGDLLVAVRRDLHQHPEPGFQEFRTAGIVAATLRELGIEVREGVAQTGVLGFLKGGHPGKTILVRADMDCLPLKEETGRAFASQKAGFMHACGHDAHVSIALGAARILAARRESLAGNVVFCFQPAEEGPGGALPMIEAGALTTPIPVDAAVGLHVRNDLDVGTIGVRPGPVMAAVDSMDITLSGRGGHGGAPHQTRDLIVVSAHLITALQTIRSRRIDPQDPAVVTIGAIHGGTANNILPDRVVLSGTIRSFDARIRAQLEEEIRAIVGGVASTFGVAARVDYRNGYPVTQNDPTFTALVQEAAATVLKESQVLTPRALMGAEDMSYYLERVPGCFFFLGTRNPDRGCDAPHHSSQFDLDEDAMQIGVQVFERVVSRYLERSR